MSDNKTEFEQELAKEDAGVAESKLQECGHPRTAIVSKGKGELSTSFCSICEAEARAMSSFGTECIVCEAEIEGSYYCCVNYGEEPVCLACHNKMLSHVCLYQQDDLPTQGLAYQYDEDTDVLTVEGIKYAGSVFRAFGIAPIGTTFKIVERKDGIVTVRRVE